MMTTKNIVVTDDQYDHLVEIVLTQDGNYLIRLKQDGWTEQAINVTQQALPVLIAALGKLP